MATAVASANIALVKYWGKRPGSALTLPAAGSLSLTPGPPSPTTRVELIDGDDDILVLDGVPWEGDQLDRRRRSLEAGGAAGATPGAPRGHGAPAPTPRPAPARGEPGAPEAVGVGRFRGEYEQVSRVAADGTVYAPGPVPAGEYRIVALFPGRDKARGAGLVTVSSGGDLSLDDARSESCGDRSGIGRAGCQLANGNPKAAFSEQ